MKIHEIIRQKREELGFGLKEMAERLDISLECLRDIEDYEDEISEVWDIAMIKKISAVIHVPPSELLGIEDMTFPIQIERHNLIRLKREQHEMNQEELSNKLGYTLETIQQIEEQRDSIEHTLSYSAVIELSRILDIPLQSLLDI